MASKITVCFLIALIFCFSFPLAAHAITVGSSQTYDCNNGTVGNITINNAHDVTVKNCKISITSGNGIQITDSSNVTINNIDIASSVAEGSGINLESTSNNATHNITIDGFYIHGPMGWGIAGSYQSLSYITVKNGTFENIGQAGGNQKHSMYTNNWQHSLIDNVIMKGSWNTGLKVVGNTDDVAVNRVTIINSGRFYTGSSWSSSGPAVSLADGGDTINNWRFTNSTFANNIAPAIYTDQDSGITNITIDHNTMYNNYYSVQVPASSGKGWKVTNNIGYNDSSYKASLVPLQLEGGIGSITPNNFSHNLWYTKGSSTPVRVNGTFMTFSIWQGLAGSLDLGSKTGDPLFSSVDSGSANFLKFSSSSPAKGAASDGTDMGRNFGVSTVLPPSATSTTKTGDVNGDNSINIIDIGIILDDYGKNPITYPKSDINKDATINVVDIGIIVSNYGK